MSGALGGDPAERWKGDGAGGGGARLLHFVFFGSSVLRFFGLAFACDFACFCFGTLAAPVDPQLLRPQR